MAMAGAERLGHCVQIGHAFHVDPEGGHGDHEIGTAEAELPGNRDPLRPTGYALADQVLAGDAHVDPAFSQSARDLDGRQHDDLEVVDALGPSCILPCIASARDLDTALREPGDGLGLDASLRGQGQGQNHGRPPRAARTASGRIIPPTAGIGRAAPRRWVMAS